MSRHLTSKCKWTKRNFCVLRTWPGRLAPERVGIRYLNRTRRLSDCWERGRGLQPHLRQTLTVQRSGRVQRMPSSGLQWQRRPAHSFPSTGSVKIRRPARRRCQSKPSSPVDRLQRAPPMVPKRTRENASSTAEDPFPALSRAKLGPGGAGLPFSLLFRLATDKIRASCPERPFSRA